MNIYFLSSFAATTPKTPPIIIVNTRNVKRATAIQNTSTNVCKDKEAPVSVKKIIYIVGLIFSRSSTNSILFLL